MSKELLLVGNPNVGKSTLFNLLTGLRQRTANYQGVTVEKKIGKYKELQVVDLPGIKSLWAYTIDEQISAKEILAARSADKPMLFVASGVNLEEHLLLFSQIADLQMPMVLVINFKDELIKNKININVEELSNKLGCAVVLVNSRSGDGVAELKELIDGNNFKTPSAFSLSNFDRIANNQVKNDYAEQIEKWLSEEHKPEDQQAIEDLEKRHLIIHSILEGAVKYPPQIAQDKRTEKFDAVLLHPFWGTLIFFFILFLVFQAIFTFATVPMEWIDGFFGNLSTWAENTIAPAWLGSLIGKGIFTGLGGVLIFIPQIAILFFLFGILESSGYMSRISFLSDNVLKRFGLSGTSVVPLVSGLACAIPAIMSARAIKNERERLAIILATPFMTCSARLPVYTIIIALIFPDDSFLGIFNLKGVALFSLYFLGTLMSLIAAWIITKFKDSGKREMWILELPSYRPPHWKKVFSEVYLKTKSFVVDAGKVILIFNIFLWFLSYYSPQSEQFINAKASEQFSAYPAQGEANAQAAAQLEYSYSGYIGKFVEPVIQPLGYDWKIGIALFSSFAAREVFVGTLSTIYSLGTEEEEEATIISRLKKERIPGTNEPRFNFATCISLLLFYAFALQCMSTVAIVRKETGSWKWPIIQFVAMLVLAYASAFIAYQLLS